MICRTCNIDRDASFFNLSKYGYKCQICTNEYRKLWKREQSLLYRKCNKCSLKKDLTNFNKIESRYSRICIDCWEISDNAINGRSNFNKFLIQENKLRCGVCKDIKSINFFGKDRHSKIGFKTICKSCLPIREKAVKIKGTYNLTLKNCIELLKNQNNSCGICKKPLELISNDKSMQINIDHCHNTNKIRGLLCSNCNRGLGLLKDSVQTLYSAIRYLKNNGSH